MDTESWVRILSLASPGTLDCWIVDNFLSASYLVYETSRRSFGRGRYSAPMRSEL